MACKAGPSERTPLLTFVDNGNEPRSGSDAGTASIWSETRHIVKMAVPLILLCVMRYWMIGITVFTIGRLGVTELAAASLGLLHTNVVALSIVIGLNAALDTLANQAAGSATPHLASLYAMRQFVVNLSLLPIIFVLMWFGTSIVSVLSPNADKEMLHLAQLYLRIMFFCVPAYAGSDCLRRFCQSVGHVNGPTLAHVISMPVSVGLNILLVHGPPRWRLGFIGAPVAVVIAYNVMFLVMLAYAVITTPKSAWCGFSRAIFQDLGLNYSIGFAGAVALCSEWWAFELLGLSAVYLGTASQAVAAIFVSIISAAFPVPYAVSMAAAMRVGNLLGAGDAYRANMAAKAARRVAVTFTSIAFVTILCLSDRIGHLYSHDPSTLATLKEFILVPALGALGDGTQIISAGILRGAGLPRLAMKANLTAFWGLGVWTSLLLGSLYKNLPAFWSGYLLAQFSAQLIIMNKIHHIDWNEQAALCKIRLASSSRRDEEGTA